MRLLLIFSAASMLIPAVCGAQDRVVGQASAAAFEASAAADADHRSYVVQLTEFRLKSASDTKMTADDIVAKFTEGGDDVEVVQTVRLSTLTGFESFAQFGTVKSITTSWSSGSDRRGGGGPPSAPVRSTTDYPVGTIARVKLSPVGDSVAMQLKYEKSYVEGDEGKEFDPATYVQPDRKSSQYETTLLLEPGKPAFVGGTSGDDSTYLVVSVSDAKSSSRAGE